MKQKQRSVLIIADSSSQGEINGAAEIQARRVEAQLGVRVRHVLGNCDDAAMHKALLSLSFGSTEEIVVIPLFFASSMFTDVTVPQMVGLEEGTTSGTVDIDGKRVRVRVGRPFGTDSLMRGVLGTVLARCGAEAGRTAVMLIGHGSKDGRNSAAVEFNAGIAREYGYDAFPCYNETINPAVDAALEDVLSRGYEDILAIPMFVSSSRHTAVEIPSKLGLSGGARERTFERDGKSVRLRYATEIGKEPGIADIICRMVES